MPPRKAIERREKKIITLEVKRQIIWPITKPVINVTDQRNQLQFKYRYGLNFDLYIKSK